LRPRTTAGSGNGPAVPAPGDEPEETFWGLRTQAPAIGVQSNTSWPCGQDSHLTPECHRRRKRATRREAWVTGFDCGAGDLLQRRLPHRPVGVARSDFTLGGSSPLPSGRTQQRDEKG
jgi:hypothetical protein